MKMAFFSKMVYVVLLSIVIMSSAGEHYVDLEAAAEEGCINHLLWHQRESEFRKQCKENPTKRCR